MVRFAAHLKSAVLASLAGLTLLCTSYDTTSAYTYQVIHTFCQDSSGNCTDGGAPLSGMAMDAAGNFYGVTHGGGAKGAGVVYELSPAGGGNWNYKVLHSFCSAGICFDGTSADASLVIDTTGNLYGTTEQGGKYLNGVIFVLRPNAKRTKWTLKVLHDFCPTEDLTCSDGAFAIGALTYAGAASGALYDGTSPLFGTTAFGGTHGWGTAFQLSQLPGGKRWKLKTLYSFCALASCADGAVPYSTPIVDQTGNLIGTTAGSNNSGNQGGNVFELKPNTKRTKWTESVLYGFCASSNCTDGNLPISSVLMGPAGNLLGVTELGGGSGLGVAFDLTLNGTQWQESLMHSFCFLSDCIDGSEPSTGAALVADLNGNLFGTTFYGGGNDVQQGGRGAGTVFELGSGPLHLYSFCAEPNCTDGANPVGNLIVDGRGDIFGVTYEGGAEGPNNSGGTIFELTP